MEEPQNAEDDGDEPRSDENKVSKLILLETLIAAGHR